VVGQNDVVTSNPRQPLENLRPQIIYDALLLREIKPPEIAVLQDGKETMVGNKGHSYEQPDYEIDVIRDQGTDYWLSRKIVFNRQTLLPDRQMIYDQSGTLVTDAKYSEYKDYNGVNFPSRIEITRPQEEYDITLNVVKMDFNKALNDNTFVLEQPAGVQVIHLDHNAEPSNGGGTR
jgi:outer membrane lipoprotein-sorting protein